MELSYWPKPLTFWGDAGMMEQVLVNLAVNARDACPTVVFLKITTALETRVPPPNDGATQAPAAATFVKLSVSDNVRESRRDSEQDF